MPATPNQPSRRATLAILAAVFLFTLAIQYPGILSFQKFGFYDEGSWLHLDQLFSQGRIPTVDLGYSYGMLPLILSHWWFATFGRTPLAFLGFLSTCNLLSVAAIASILSASGASWRRLGAACVLLPMAVLPSNYSLMHPLEMLLILWAIACQTRGRYAAALAFAVAAVFTKPSMPYVLGLLLLLFGLLPKNPNQSPLAPAANLIAVLRSRLAANWRIVILPAFTALALLLLSILSVGIRPAFANILPLTGGRSYHQMDFGIFHAGLSFWLFTEGTWRDILIHYLFTPALFWILASLLAWVLGFRAAYRLWRARQVGQAAPRAGDPIVFTLAALHAAFVFVFYAWAGSWTYYSYLPVLALLVGLRGHRQTLMLRGLLVVALLGMGERFGDARNRWYDLRTPDTGGLYAYSNMPDETHHVRQLAQEHHALFLINGCIPLLWPEARAPQVWFVSPGIPTDSEINAIRQQINDSGAIVLFKKYDQKQEAWFWPEFAQERKAFELRTWQFGPWTIKEPPLYEGEYFIVYARHPTPSDPATK